MTTMLSTTPHPVERPLLPYSAQVAPFSPMLINLNQRYNMSANTLTEALLLLSGMYISLVQPEPALIDINIHAIYPDAKLGDYRNVIIDAFANKDRHIKFEDYSAVSKIFNISSSRTLSMYSPKDILTMLCDNVFPRNTITVFFLNSDLATSKHNRSTVSYLPKIIESLGLPIISYDTQYSPNARPELSIQLAPTMGQMIDVMFAFLRKFGWTDFSFLCTLSYGCEDEISFIRLKVEESKQKQNISEYGVDLFSYHLLSYVNFTNGTNETEVRDKLMYELHKDSRINLFHGSGLEVKSVMDVAKELGLTSQDYVWIYTAASITLKKENADVSGSYPLGSFVLWFDHSLESLVDTVKNAISLWLQALNSLMTSRDFENIDFNTGFSCDRFKDTSELSTNDSTKSPLYWKYGKLFYQHLLKSKLSGNLEFDEFGVLKANRFYIMNVQLQPRSNTSSTSGGRPVGVGLKPSSPFRPHGMYHSRPRQDSGHRYTRVHPPQDMTTGQPLHQGRDSVSSPLSRDRNSRFPRLRGSGSSFPTDSGSQYSQDGASDPTISTDENSNPSRFRQSGSRFSSRGDSRYLSSRNRHHGSYLSPDRDSQTDLYAGEESVDGRIPSSAPRGEISSITDLEDQSRERSRRDTKRRQIAKKVADWDGHTLDLYGITWPGGATKPPKGKPEKYVLRVVTWQEDPHVIFREKKTSVLGNEEVCEANSVPCLVYNRDKNLHRTNGTKDMCCTGLCIDLLKNLGEMLHFEVNLTEVPDFSYGTPLNSNNTDWNGMLGMLIHKEADMAIGALSITPERSVAVDFSVPFLQTGITIIVALRHGVISATAFLEPYDYLSWSLILLFSVHATGASIFIFEWLSPYGLDQGKTSFSVHKFSLCRSFWLIWAMLFSASVSTDQPRGIASRFLANIWALFAVVFCASYTANLAAFMITKDTYYDLSGIQDWRLRNPYHVKPPFKFATIANSSTDLSIRKNYPEIHQYMKSEAQTDVKEAIKNLKRGIIQAFIYDSTTLEYEVGKDDGCKLKTVGKRIAETGYGVAFPRRSQWVKFVDRALLQLQESGEIERLQKHWLASACHNKKETGVSSHTLGILNFTSAFVLLGSGVVLGVLILMLEHMYFRFGRKSLKKLDKSGCCSLVSLSMGQSLTFEQSVIEAMDYHKHHRCKDPLCETQLWKAKHDLDIALLKISQLRCQIAHSASRDDEKGFGSHMSPEASPRKNGAARRRRQNPGDAATTKCEKSVNQPLLAQEGQGETDEDSSPGQSPKHQAGLSSPRTSFPASKPQPGTDSYIPLQGFRKSYPGPGNSSGPTGRLTDERLSKMINSPKNVLVHDDNRTRVTNPDLHPPPPSFEEALSGYKSFPEEDIMTPSPSPPLPPPPPESPTPLHQSPQEGVSALSDSNSSPSSGDKRYEPLMLDSPESPSFSSFSETSGKELSGRGNISRLSEELASSPASQDIDSSLTSSPDACKSLDDSNILPPVGFTGGHFSNAQTKIPSSSTDSMIPSELQSDPSKDTLPSLAKTSKEADNDVNTRRARDGDGNIYVNVDDIVGKETSF